MNARRLVLFAFLIIVAALGVFWLRRERLASIPATAPRSASQPVAASAMPSSRAKLDALAAEIAPDAVSPIAKDLGAPGGNIRHDLELLNEVFVAWETNFPRQGNPVGENNEITLALAGDNALKFAFIAPDHPAINAQGELCDRWGTPFRLHQLSGTQMEIRSAGPDRKFATADDVQFAP